MKISRILIIIVVIVVIGIVALFLYESLVVTRPSGSPQWVSAAQYPLNVDGTYGAGGQACVNSSSYIYCVGGTDANGGPRDDVYSSSPLSSSSIDLSSWTTDPNVYPMTISSSSCVEYNNNIYCVGGINDDNLDDTAATYYASLNSGIIGTWTLTTSYPIPIDTETCVTSSGFIYCVAGDNQTGGVTQNAVNSTSAYYAPLSNSGIGNWTHTTTYPSDVFYPVCYAALGNIYCVGGVSPNDNAANSVYYASLSPSGIGSWTETTAYPISASGQACAIVSSVIYCVGGEGNGNTYYNSVYYATISSSGVGSWTLGAAYTDSVVTGCEAISGTMYCVGGFISAEPMVTADVNYASLTGITTTTSTSP
ncbi:MAG TPA: hypothetical protein VED17_04655 [Nitrososphaerales archaeon]|nr:hypothetical protein [Nitrososphaerales archaeon]